MKDINIDRIFALVYLAVGYGFIYTFSSMNFEKHIAIFTVFYAATVLFYLFTKNIKPAKESWFWFVVLIAIGISYAFWSVMAVLQIMALIAVAAYWTLSASGRLLDKKKTSKWVFFDGCNSIAVVPFCNFLCQPKVLFRINSTENEGKEESMRGNIRAILFGIAITFPILIIILPLLSKADAGFEHLAGNAVVFVVEHFMSIFIRLIFALPVSAYLYGLIFGGISGRNTERFQIKNLQDAFKRARCIPDVAVCTALVIFGLIYVLFIGLQVTYLFSAFYR